MLYTKLAATLLILLMFLTCAHAAEAPDDEMKVRELAEEVDVLKLITDLELDEKQINSMLTAISNLKQKSDDTRKREAAILAEIKGPLQKMKEAMLAGKDVPPEEEDTASRKLKELQGLRTQAWQGFDSAVRACTRLLDPGQVKAIARDTTTMSRATQMLRRVRTTPHDEWPDTLKTLTEELVAVKKIDKLGDWQKETDRIRNLSDEERDRAQAEFDRRKAEEIAQMESEAAETLTSIRNADERLMSIALSKLAARVRPESDVQSQLLAMIARILDSTVSEALLKARLETIKTNP